MRTPRTLLQFEVLSCRSVGIKLCGIQELQNLFPVYGLPVGRMRLYHGNIWPHLFPAYTSCKYLISARYSHHVCTLFPAFSPFGVLLHLLPAHPQCWPSHNYTANRPSPKGYMHMRTSLSTDVCFVSAGRPQHRALIRRNVLRPRYGEPPSPPRDTCSTYCRSKAIEWYSPPT
jgi:hypothetical protein